ncbi:hypothetical protein ACQI4E_26155 [Streptomyces sp. CA-252508]|uniref:hypothetical protein n=1 Tax=Streptomyces sp. CA-252508 TaxID=3418946 RepID=UPI003D901823
MLITQGPGSTRLTATMGAHPATPARLAGLGDLVATCSSPLSGRPLGGLPGGGRHLSPGAPQGCAPKNCRPSTRGSGTTLRKTATHPTADLPRAAGGSTPPAAPSAP